MQKNEVYRMTAESLGADMEGVCRLDGQAVFVPGLLPGEEADVRIVKTEKRYAFGRMEALPPRPSPDRREPDCPAYPRCGGCTARHMSYEATLAAKQQHVRDCFQRIGKIDVSVPPVLGMEHPFAYRNKTALPVGGTSLDPILGFYAPRSHSLIPAAACPNAMPPSGDIASAVQAWIREHNISIYNEETHRGLLRHLVIRVNRKGEAMVTLAANGDALPAADHLWNHLSPLGVKSLYLNENRLHSNLILSDRFVLLFGQKTLSDSLCGLQFELSPASFFQINPLQTERLYSLALEFAELTDESLLCDVYCGAGTITLMMARHCARAVGIEIVPDAIRNAKENARRNGLHNVDFYAGSAETLLPRMVQEGLRPDVIVVDPPRKGLEESVIDAIAAAGPSRLVYVSCNPATQARDAALLLERGYHVRRLQPVDMFPFTSHVETVLLMSQQKPDDTILVGNSSYLFSSNIS